MLGSSTRLIILDKIGLVVYYLVSDKQLNLKLGGQDAQSKFHVMYPAGNFILCCPY